MNSNGIVHCTVDHNGKLTIFESPAAALKTKLSHEVLVQLTLTVHQIRDVLRAAQLSKSKMAAMPAGPRRLSQEEVDNIILEANPRADMRQYLAGKEDPRD
jgi:hypothetical protein